MDLDKVRNGLQEIQTEQEEASKPAEEPSFLDRLASLPGEFINAMGQQSVVTSQGNLEAAQETSDMASHAAGDIASAASNLSERWQDFRQKGAELQAAYTPAAIQQANETGDYSAQDAAVASAQQAGDAVTDGLRDLALSPARYEVNKYINQYANADGNPNQAWAQSLQRSNAGLEYFLTDADKLTTARDIEESTGIPAEAFLNDTTAYRQALDIYHYKQKVDAVGGSVEAVWDEFPELKDVANMDVKAAALALHELDNIRQTHGIIETFTHALETGNKELEYNNLMWKIATGQADDNDKERAEDIKASLARDRKATPSFIEDPIAAIVTGVGQSAPEMWQSMVEGARDASVAATAAMLAGAAAGSTVAPGIGTAGGAVAGMIGGAAVGFGRSLITNTARRQLASAALQAGFQTGMFTGMLRPEVGQRYAEYKEMKDKDGNPLLTDNQARGWAFLGGMANAGIEMANFGVITKALAGAPHAKRVFGDIIEQFGAGLTAREAFTNMLKDRAADIAKVTLSESGEEGLQSISDDLIHNQIEFSTGDTSNKVYSFGDIAGHAFMSFAQSLPASFGFGLLGAGGGMVTRGIGITAGMRNRASFEARYGENARKTVTGTLMVERLQQVIAQNNMKEKAPDVQRTILRSELKNTGYENSYIDTEIAMEKEHGLDDLKKVAKAANISDEDLQTAIEEKGTIMVPTEQYAQSAASPDLLDAVSYAQEADSIGRMRKDAQGVMEQMRELQKQAIERQTEAVQNVINQYFPSEEAATRDPQQAQIRELATAAVFANPENPAKGWASTRKELQDKLDAILAPAMQALQDGMGKGGQILEVHDENDHVTYKRTTENAEWYRNFYATFHRAPTKDELTQMAIALTTGDASAPKVMGFIPQSEEEQQAMADSKREIDYLQQALTTLDKIKPTMQKLNGVEMKLTEGLSSEAFTVYRTVSDQLKAFGGLPARAARVSAILTARHADIVAGIISKKTGKKYTALDYMRERYGFDAEGKYIGDNALHQPVTELDLELDKQIPVLDLDTMDTSLRNKEPKEVIAYIKEKLPRDAIPTADFKAMIGAPNDSYGATHIVRNKSAAAEENRIARNAALTNIDAVIRHSYLIEVVPNEKIAVAQEMPRWKRKAQRRKNSIDEFYRLIIPVRIDGEQKTLIIVAENKHGKVSINQNETNLYEIYTAKEENHPVRLSEQNTPDTRATEDGSPSTISIRDTLRGVKDYLFQPYVDENGNANYGVYLQNGVMYLGQNASLNQLAWHGSPHVFDHFDLGAIGTGEGARVHGWGLYFAKNREMSEKYRAMLAGKPESVALNGTTYHYQGNKIIGPDGKAVDDLPLMLAISELLESGSKEKTLDRAKGAAALAFDKEQKETWQRVQEIIENSDVRFKQDGTLLEVDVPENDVLLDEQKQFEDQPENVKAALLSLGIANATGRKGQQIYDELCRKLGSDRAASLALNEAGIKGLRYTDDVDGECFVVFDDKAVSIIDRYNQAANAKAAVRGTTTVMQDGRRIVSLTQSADESTYMHEMSHIFLMDLGDLAQIDETSAKELEVVNQWAEWHRGDAALYKGSPWAAEFRAREESIIAAEDAGDFDEADRLKNVWRQERFARAFEQYLRDGQAPARGLRAVFRKFKQFLRQIYQAVIADGTKASEPVRRIMDRMIATEDEITEMELDDRYKDISKAGGEKLFNESEQDTYKRWQKEAAEEAKEKLMKELMQDLNAKVDEEFNARVAKEDEDYRRELMNEPVYLAMQAAVASGSEETVLGWFPSIEAYTKAIEEAPTFEDALKEHMDAYKETLEAELIRTHLSEENVTHIMESTLYRAKLESLKATAFAKKQRLINTITSKAERAMSSVEEKITALPEDTDLKVERFDKSVKDVMKEINRLRFSTRWSTADIERIEGMLQAATKEELAKKMADFKLAVQNDKANEKAVEKANEGRMHAYKDMAKKSLAGKPLHEACDYNGYIRQAKKAAKQVQQMVKAKRWDMAILAQQRQAMAMALAEESRKLRQHVDKLTGQVKRQLQARTVRLPKDERYWHRHLAYMLRITSTDAQKPASGCAGLDALFSDMTASLDMQEGFSPTDILEMANEQGADFKGWQSLTMNQFEDAVNAMNILYTTGKNKFNMVTVGGKAIADVVDEIIHDDSEASRVGVQRRVVNEDIGGLGYNEWLAKLPGGEAAARMGVKALSAITKPEEILRALGTKAHKYIYGIYERAREQEGKRIADEMAALQKILAPYSHKERQAWKKRNIRLNDQQGMLSKENIICMALNLGNATNRQRLAGGFQMTEQDIVDFVEKHMTAKDWQLVQDIWDHLNTYWQDTVAVEEKLNGMAIRKVEAVPFTVKASDTGEQIRLKGGYYPIAYNPKKSSKAAENAENALARGNMSGAMVLGTNRGFTKSRAEVDIEGRPLLLEFSVVPDHLQAVIHNITFRLAARDVYRLINNKDFEAHVADTLGSEYHAILKEWATDVWNITGNNNVAENVIGKVFNWLRANSTMSIMGYRIWPVVENISNIAPVIDKLGAAETAAAIADFYTNIGEARHMLTKSVFMQNRINSLDRDIRQQPGLFSATYRPIEIIRDHAYDLMLYSDLMLSAPLWLRSYKNAFGAKLAEVRKENAAHMQALRAAQDKVDGIKAQLLDLAEGKLPERAELSPFDVVNMTEAEGMDYLDRQQKDLEKDLFKAEQEFQQATELPIYTDAEIISEAERRAVFAADGAVRDTFGSGATMDQSSIQRTRNAAIKLMTTFYSFFNTQFNAILASYRHAKFSEGSYITRWAPFARSMMLRLVLMALIGSTMKFAFGLEGSGDDDKWKREKGSDGKETKVAVPWQERFLKVFGNNAMSQTFGAFPLVRDFANLMASYLFNGTTYGKSSADFFSVGMRGFTEGWRAVTMLAKKSEQNLELQEQEEKREQAWQERLKKLKGKKRAEAIRKHEEEEKYRHPQKPITYSDVAKHGARALSSLTAARVGITSTMADAVTTTMQYLNDSSDRYDKTWTNMVWSVIWDKNPVEREIAPKPPAEAKPKKGKKKSQQK